MYIYTIRKDCICISLHPLSPPHAYLSFPAPDISLLLLLCSQLHGPGKQHTHIYVCSHACTYLYMYIYI